MIIYKLLEPQPEISIIEHGEVAWRFLFDCCEFYDAPHKIGDEIEYFYDWMAHKGFVKSIKPVNKDGLWQWEIEVGEK